MILSDEEIQDIRNRAKLNDNRQIEPMAYARAIERAVLDKVKASPAPKQQPLLIGHWEQDPVNHAIRYTQGLVRCSLPTGTPIYAYSAPPQAAAIPEFLIEMSHQMREQDNRGTSHPFFQVRCKRYIVTEQGYNEHHWEICGDEGVVYSSLDPIERLYDYLNENNEEFVNYWNKENHVDDLSGWFDVDDDEHFPDGLRRIYVQEIEEIVTTHLTEAAAHQFIARKQHDYPKLYTYAESAYWSPQLRQLQDWIISLSAAPKPEGE